MLIVTGGQVAAGVEIRDVPRLAMAMLSRRTAGGRAERAGLRHAAGDQIGVPQTAVPVAIVVPHQHAGRRGRAAVPPIVIRGIRQHATLSETTDTHGQLETVPAAIGATHATNARTTIILFITFLPQPVSRPTPLHHRLRAPSPASPEMPLPLCFVREMQGQDCRPNLLKRPQTPILTGDVRCSSVTTNEDFIVSSYPSFVNRENIAFSMGIDLFGGARRRDRDRFRPSLYPTAR